MADKEVTVPVPEERVAEFYAWYGRLAPAARELFDLVAASPGRRFSGNDVAARLGLEKGAHGVAGILAWPGRYCRHLGRALPIATEGRPDGGTDYFMEPGVAGLFARMPGEAGEAGEAGE
jgi:hypothetical protein